VRVRRRPVPYPPPGHEPRAGRPPGTVLAPALRTVHCGGV